MRMLTDVPIAFLMIAAVTLVSAVCAMSLRNLVHCGLCLVLTFVGLAAAYLHLSAELSASPKSSFTSGPSPF